MKASQRFEDIEAWQKARELTKAIDAQSNNGQFARAVGLRDQIRWSSVSIMSSSTEGCSRGVNKEFIQFLRGFPVLQNLKQVVWRYEYGH